MATENIVPFDMARILIGSTPWGFLMEVMFRTAVLFMISLVFMRLLGRRTVRQLTLFDQLIIIALGTSVGEPMVYPDTALLWGVFVIITVVLMFKLQNTLLNRSAFYQDIALGTPRKIISNGVIDVEMMHKVSTTREEVFLMLRNKSVRHLGELEAVYIERNGSLSIYKLEPDKVAPGLTTLSDDLPGHPEHHKTNTKIPRSDYYSCFVTGETKKLEEGDIFPACRGDQWIESTEP